MKIAITGASGGIGQAFVKQLAEHSQVNQVKATFRREIPQYQHAKVSYTQLDITQEESIKNLAQAIGEIDWFINAIGI